MPVMWLCMPVNHLQKRMFEQDGPLEPTFFKELRSVLSVVRADEAVVDELQALCDSQNGVGARDVIVTNNEVEEEVLTEIAALAVAAQQDKKKGAYEFNVTLTETLGKMQEIRVRLGIDTALWCITEEEELAP